MSLRDPLRTEDYSDLDSASRAALAKQLEAMAEWNRAMSLFVATYQLDVIATFRAALVNRWRRVWVHYAMEGCVSTVVVMVSLLSLGFLIVLLMVNR
jgi:hypothetical protein